MVRGNVKMVSNKALLAKRLQENTLKHQEAQKEHVKELKELKRNIPIVDIQASPHQPRQFFAANELQELADSIAEIGLLQPISVRRVEKGYEIIAGERRLRAHQLLNKANIEAIVVDVNDEDAALLTLAENLKRQDLTDYEIYLGLHSLSPELKKNKQKLAKSLGMIREDMYKYLSYEKLPSYILQDLNQQPNVLSRTAATALKKFLTDHHNQAQEAERVLEQAWTKLLKKEIEQTKLALYAEKQLIQNQQSTVKKIVPMVQQLKLDGKVAGDIKFDQESLKVSLKIKGLTQDHVQQLEHFLQQLFNDTQTEV